MEVFDLSNLDAEHTSRILTSWDELDWAYGSNTSYGLPSGSISLWSGAPGIGKTRLLVELMKRFDQMNPPQTSMIFQGEISPARFKGEKMGDYIPCGNIWVSGDVAIDEQIAAIDHYKPRLVITDSVQQIEEYRGGRGAKEIVRKIRDVIERTDTHVIFISQLTREGKSKGGTDLPHEVDVECIIESGQKVSDSLFVLTVGKNRFGCKGREVVFAHHDWGVRCESNNRFEDDDFLESIGVPRYESPVVKPRGRIQTWLFGPGRDSFQDSF